MKKRLIFAALALVMVFVFSGMVSTAAKTADPSDNYVVQTAPNEDPSISLWFEHSFDKIYTSDVTPSGMNTYSIYMARNEIENAQFVLYSDVDHTNMNATVSKFTDGNGNTIDAEIYYQLYVTLSDINHTYIDNDIDPNVVREGECPDATAPLSAYTRGFKLNAGKSQAFYIRAKTTEDTPTGWYSAQLDILDADKNIVKTATVYAYVWNFTLSEETALQTAFYMNANPSSYDYKTVYDYFLENRIVIMDPPGSLNADNEYLTNDRVNAIRVTANGGGQVNSYKDGITTYSAYKDIYTSLSSMAAWEDIKDKFYFYTVDEPMSQEMHDGQVAAGVSGCETIDDAIRRLEQIEKFWPDAQAVIPYHENHPYPYYRFGTNPLSTYDEKELKDGIEAMIESDCQTFWCPQARAFTPNQLLKDLGYDGNFTPVGARSIHGTVSGNILSSEHYYNWDDLFGMTRDRVISSNIVKLRDENNQKDYQLWSYIASSNGSQSYCNFLVENSGLQTKMQMWQLYQEDVTGYLYYAVTSWLEDTGADAYVDRTTTGAYSTTFKPHRSSVAGGYSYGMGTLVYQNTMGKTKKVDYIGTIRVEHMRDGIEDYQMMYMLEQYAGNVKAKSYVNSVCNNVVEYLSLPNYDRSAHDPSLSDSDVMALTRIELGNAVEAAVRKNCSHNYGEGVVTKEPTCLEMGVKTYTCSDCGAVDTEYLPTLHAEGDCFELIEGGIVPTCGADGKQYYKCTICGYEKYLVTTAYHKDRDYYAYDILSDKIHVSKCSLCGEEFEYESHQYSTKYTNTCTEDGYAYEVCIYCGYEAQGDAVEAHGHYWRDGVCTACGETDPEYVPELPYEPTPDEPDEPEVPQVTPGDLNADGKVNLADVFIMKGIIAGSVTPTEEQMLAGDLNSDSKINLADIYLLKVLVIA